jgi:hypothetical protein
MSKHMDCRWIEDNLEALFCDRLDPQQSQQAQAHIEGCSACRREVQAFNAIDPVIKNYFQGELKRARQPRRVHAGRLFGLSAATLSLATVILFLVLRVPQISPVLPSVPVASQPPAAANVEPAAEIKNTDSTPAIVERAKPAGDRTKPADRLPAAKAAVSRNAPEFLVNDPAGYSRNLEDFRGHIVVMGLWSGAPAEAIANLERLYKTYGSNARFRFVGVSNQSLAKPANATFPVFYNQGSRVLGAQPGEFVLLDENGGVALRGSLVKDFEELQRFLQKIS